MLEMNVFFTFFQRYNSKLVCDYSQEISFLSLFCSGQTNLFPNNIETLSSTKIKNTV